MIQNFTGELVGKIYKYVVSGASYGIVFALVWLCALNPAYAEVSANAGGVVLGGGLSTSISVDPCLNAADSAACHNGGSVEKLVQSPSRVSASVTAPTPNPTPIFAPEESGEFERFVSSSLGKPLPIFGRNLFVAAPSSFAPLDNIPVTGDYLIGPGDELQIRGWGQVDFDLMLEVDRDGTIYLPRVGSVNVAGVRYHALHGHLKNAISRVFRNFELSVTMGKLRSIQVYVVGQAKRPGAYTVSSLSSLVNTLFVSGGPTVKGSLRHIQVRRNGAVVTELDLYEFLLKGDKSHDISLQPGDVIYIPPVGPLAAIAGSVNSPAIYELSNEGSTLADLIQMSGGLSSVAEGGKVRVERIDDRKTRNVEEFVLNKSGLARALKDGDVVQVGSISGQFGNAITLRGNVASPGRYPWKAGMRVSDLIPNMDALILPEYWVGQNRAFRTEASSEGELRTQIKRNQNEINWDYALVERLNKDEMTTALIPFNLGKAIAREAENDIALQSGDVITIFSQNDIQVPAAKRSVYVRLEGEFNHAGVYKANPGETLRQLVARVGGLTPQAYLFGSELTRESTRLMQQKRLVEIVDRMEADVQRVAAQASSASLSKEDVMAAKEQVTAQTALIAKMREVRATGRIVMDLPEQSPQLNDLPDIVLEDGDRLYVPAPASTVSVMGAVYNQNAFLYKRGQKIDEYLEKAGGPSRDGDEDDIYLVRADGVVFSSRQNNMLFSGFGGREALPGDTIVVPEKLEKLNLTKEFKDWTQIFYQFAVGVASLKAINVF